MSKFILIIITLVNIFISSCVKEGKKINETSGCKSGRLQNKFQKQKNKSFLGRKKDKRIDILNYVVDTIEKQKILFIDFESKDLRKIRNYKVNFEQKNYLKKCKSENCQSIRDKGKYSKIDFKKYQKIFLNIKDSSHDYNDFVIEIIKSIPIYKTKLYLIIKGRENIEKFKPESFYFVKDQTQEILPYHHCKETKATKICVLRKKYFINGPRIKDKIAFLTVEVYDPGFRIPKWNGLDYVDLQPPDKIKVFGYLTHVNGNIVVDVPHGEEGIIRFILEKNKVYEFIEKQLNYKNKIILNGLLNRKKIFKQKQCKNHQCVFLYKSNYGFENPFYHMNLIRITPVMISVTGKFKFLYSSVTYWRTQNNGYGKEFVKYKKRLGLKYNFLGVFSFVLNPESFKIELTQKHRPVLVQKRKEIIDSMCKISKKPTDWYSIGRFLKVLLKLKQYLAKMEAITPYLKRNKTYYLPFLEVYNRLYFDYLYVIQNADQITKKEISNLLKFPRCSRKNIYDTLMIW